MATMRAVVYRGAGDACVVELAEVPAPVPGPGQVAIAVRASGVNRADLSQRRGHYPPPPGESDIPGLEVSGTVVENGPGAGRFRPGERVMALLAAGGYAERVCVDEGLVLALAERLPFEEGAAIPEAFLTAYRNLFELGAMRRGQSVLIHAGASGVGTAALQLVGGVASRAFATVGTAGKAAACRALGATPILYRDEDFAARVLQETGNAGVDLVLDPVGASYLAGNLKCLAVGGTLVHIGLLGGGKAELDLGVLMQKRARLIGSALRALPLAQKRASVAAFAGAFLERFAAGTLRPVMDRVFPAAEAALAQGRMEANLNTGKIVLRWD